VLDRSSQPSLRRRAAAPLDLDRNHNRHLSALSLRNCYEKQELVAPRDLLGSMSADRRIAAVGRVSRESRSLDEDDGYDYDKDSVRKAQTSSNASKREFVPPLRP